MADQHAGKIDGNGMLQKIILGIASSLCILLIGVLLASQQSQSAMNRETAERLARLETKMDILLRNSVAP
jgi:hypothetical protein